MKFYYQARTKDGEIKTGIIEASSKEKALELLQKRDLLVTFLEEEKKEILGREIKFLERITKKDLVIFARQLAILLSSQVPFVEALNTVAAQTKKRELREIILDLAQEIESGSSFSLALLKHRPIFSNFFIGMIRAGEAVGKLSDSLNYLADHLEKEYEIHSKTRNALIYPAIVLAVFLGVLILMIFSVIPSLEKMFSEKKLALPLITKIIFSFSNFLKNNQLFLLSLGAVFFSGLFWFLKSRKGKLIFDKSLLKIPILGELAKISILAKISFNISTLLKAGLMITEALEITEEIIDHQIYKKAIFQIKEGVKKGLPVSSISSLYPEIFPPLFNQMVLVGEKTGNLPSCFFQIGNFYQKELERSIENLLRLLEPLLIVILGILIGGLMAGVILPLYKLVGTF